jgi:hypothetical protein
MRLAIPVFAILAFFPVSAWAEAKSCAAFVVIKAYDANANSVEVEYGKGKMSQYFPRPEGSPTDTSKIPGACASRVTKTTSLAVKPTGGRMSVTQIRSNFEGKMLNDTSDAAWVPAKLKELVASKEQVVIVVRPGLGKDAPLGVTTLYLPITDAEKAEIERIEKQAEDA